jgi:transcriptional regulator with XRE-family HTH domain
MSEMSLNEALLATVRAEAAARGMSIKALATESGISPGTMANYTNRGRTMNLDTIEKLAGGLGITPERLVQMAAERRRELG